MTPAVIEVQCRRCGTKVPPRDARYVPLVGYCCQPCSERGDDPGDENDWPKSAA